MDVRDTEELEKGGNKTLYSKKQSPYSKNLCLGHSGFSFGKCASEEHTETPECKKKKEKKRKKKTRHTTKTRCKHDP